MVTISKRALLRAATAIPLACVVDARSSYAATDTSHAIPEEAISSMRAELPGLPRGIRSRMLSGINGLDMHVLEAGFEAQGRPAILLLHGFPDLAYSWRKTMLPLAAAGYHVIAPDQRGYDWTTGWDGR